MAPMISRLVIAALAGAGSFAAPGLAAQTSADGSAASEQAVQDGIAAWQRGDDVLAVARWREAADAGDRDALFNLGQAYRLGRGVATDLREAERLYAAAASSGHAAAADNYGILLYQRGEREQAMPFIATAAERGDSRAQYLLGLAHFNGDFVERDWERAYALLTLAKADGLPQADAALAQMDSYIPMEQREAGQALAGFMQAELRERAMAEAEQDAAAERAALEAARTERLALANSTVEPVAEPVVEVSTPEPASQDDTLVPQELEPVPAAAEPDPVPDSAEPVSEPVPVRVDNPPAAVTFVRNEVTQPIEQLDPDEPVTRIAEATAPQPAQPLQSATSVPAPTPTPTQPQATSGPWAVQLGAFGNPANVDRMWAKASGKSYFANARKITSPAGRLTVLFAGGFASRDAAREACNAAKADRIECLVIRN